MAVNRTDRLNSLLKQVISDVIRKEVNNPHLPEFVTVTSVDITKDLHHAKVYVSVIGTPETKEKARSALQSAAGFIAMRASKQIVIRYFPELTFFIDESVEKTSRIDELLGKIKNEQNGRPPHDE
jgi:ribosome-binding factor A